MLWNKSRRGFWLAPRSLWAARGATYGLVLRAWALASDSSQVTVSTRLGFGGDYGARTRNPQSWEHRTEGWIRPASTPGTKTEMDYRASHVTQSWGTDRYHRVKLDGRVKKRQMVRKPEGSAQRTGEQRWVRTDWEVWVLMQSPSHFSHDSSPSLRMFSLWNLARRASSWTYQSSRAESQESFVVKKSTSRVRNKPGFESQLRHP